MSKVKPLEQVAVDAARRAHADGDVRGLRDINVHAIAWKNGARIVYGNSTTARGSLVRAGKRGIIEVNEAARGTPSERSTVAHELGHLLMHEIVDHYEQCAGDTTKRSGTSYRVEREANHFSAEFLIPELWAAPFCVAPRPALDDVGRLARRCKASFEMSAIRYVQLAQAPCAVTLVAGEKIKWSLETLPFSGQIVKGRTVHAASVASRVRAGERVEGPREVSGEVWGGKAAFLEHAILFGPGNVLCWIVPT